MLVIRPHVQLEATGSSPGLGQNFGRLTENWTLRRGGPRRGNIRVFYAAHWKAARRRPAGRGI